MPIDIYQQEKRSPSQAMNSSPVDIYQSENKSSQTPSEIPNYQFRPPGIFIPQNKSAIAQSQEAGEQGIEAGKGFLKSFGNAPAEIRNIVTGSTSVPFPISNSAQETGNIGGEITQFAAPGELVKLGLKGLSYAPGIGKSINAMQDFIKNTSWLKNLVNIGRTGSETAIASGRANPQQPLKKTALSGLEGSALQAALNTLTSANPIVNAVGRMAVGGLGGYLGGNELGVSPYESIPAGMTFGATAPRLLKETGLFKEPLSMTYLSHTTPGDVATRVRANRALGTAIRPSEAANNPFLGRVEGDIGFTGTGAQELSNQEANRVTEQKNSISKLLDTIYSKNPQSKNAISQAYRNAYQWNMGPTFMQQAFSDPVIAAAEEKMLKSPAYIKKIQGIPRNNVMYLDQVARSLGDMEKGAYENLKPTDESKIYTQTRKDFQSAIDQSVPAFKQARDLSQRSIIRSNIQKQLGKGKNQEINGYQFFTKVLNNDDKYNKLYQDLKNVPQAQEMLKNMKQGWDTLIPPESTRAAVAKTQTSMNKARESTHGLIIMLKNMLGTSVNDAEAAKFIYSKDWENSFNEIQKIKDEKERRNAFLNLVTKTVAATATTGKNRKDYGNNI